MPAETDQVLRTIAKLDVPDCVREFLEWYARSEPLCRSCGERRRRYLRETQFNLVTMTPGNMEIALSKLYELELRLSILPSLFRENRPVS